MRKGRTSIFLDTCRKWVVELITVRNIPIWVTSSGLYLVCLWIFVYWTNPSIDLHLASIIQTLVFALGLFFTNLSLRYLAKSTEFTKELLELERRRDLRANLVCAWLEMTITEPIRYEAMEDLDLIHGGSIKWLKANARLINSSLLLVYDLKFEFTVKRGSETLLLVSPLGFPNTLVKVISPQVSSMSIWTIEGWIEEHDQKVSTSNNVLSGTWSEPISLTEKGYTTNDFHTLGVRFQFRCADGTVWKRDENGRLEEVK